MKPYDIDYERLVEGALRNVVKECLFLLQAQEDLGEHHFYITFSTRHKGVEIPSYLHDEYPDEMTIVLQHQFWDLQISEKKFSVMLSFNQKSERLVIPFDAITGFADPSVNFGLRFESKTQNIDASGSDVHIDHDALDDLPNGSIPVDVDSHGGGDNSSDNNGGNKSSRKGGNNNGDADKKFENNVVSFEAFKKKK